MSEVDKYFEDIEWEEQARKQAEQARKEGPEEQLRYLIALWNPDYCEWEDMIADIEKAMPEKLRSEKMQIDNIDYIIDYDEAHGPWNRTHRLSW